MRTARSLVVSRSIWWEVCPTPRIRTPLDADSPVNRMTHRCSNITLPQTSFAGSKNTLHGPHFDGLAGCENLDEMSQDLTSRYVNETVVSDRVTTIKAKSVGCLVVRKQVVCI